MPRRILTTMLCALVLGTAAAAVSRPAELTGVITQVTGAVRLTGSGVGAVPLASPWQVIRAGVRLDLPAGAAAGIACSSLRFVRLRGPVSWSLTQKRCAAGEELTPAAYAAVAPEAGRFMVVRGVLVLERDMRTDPDDDPLAPVILAPRNTTIRSPRPTVSWLRVPLPEAGEYEIVWSGRGAGIPSIRLRKSEATCVTGADGLDLCTLPWPADRPDLPPGQIFFLTVAAREGIVDPWHSSLESSVKTQELVAAGTLERRLHDLEALGLEGAALDVARAGLLAGEGLYAAAAEAYRRALATASTPALRVTLADVDLKMGLLRLSEPLYRAALDEGDPAVRAGATFGLGRLQYTRGLYEAAAASFRQAQDLYASLGLRQQEEAARQAQRISIERIPDP
jgi:hypothetical protein